MSTKPSQSSLQRGSYLDKVLETLKTSGFYWGALNANQSKALLIKKKPGSTAFLKGLLSETDSLPKRISERYQIQREVSGR